MSHFSRIIADSRDFMSKAPPPAPRPGKREVSVLKALYDYTAQNPDELSFHEGDILYIINKDHENWWKCKSGEREGLVPRNYLGENTQPMDNPLHDAAKRGNYAFVHELLSAGVSVNGLDKAGNAPIHWACRCNHIDVLQLILSHSPAINAQNKMGDTPLHMACWGGHFEVVSLLLRNPLVNLNIKNNEQKRPIDVSTSDKISGLLLNFTGSTSADALAGSDEDD